MTISGIFLYFHSSFCCWMSGYPLGGTKVAVVGMAWILVGGGGGGDLQEVSVPMLMWSVRDSWWRTGRKRWGGVKTLPAGRRWASGKTRVCGWARRISHCKSGGLSRRYTCCSRQSSTIGTYTHTWWSLSSCGWCIPSRNTADHTRLGPWKWRCTPDHPFPQTLYKIKKRNDDIIVAGT